MKVRLEAEDRLARCLEVVGDNMEMEVENIELQLSAVPAIEEEGNAAARKLADQRIGGIVLMAMIKAFNKDVAAWARSTRANTGPMTWEELKTKIIDELTVALTPVRKADEAASLAAVQRGCGGGVSSDVARFKGKVRKDVLGRGCLGGRPSSSIAQFPIPLLLFLHST